MINSDRNIVLAGAIAGITVCTGDFAVLFVFGPYYAGYSQLFNTMSSLGASASPVSDYVSLCWILLGVIFLLFAYGFRKAFTPGNKYTTSAYWLLNIYSFGELMGSGFFKADFVGGAPTVSAILHGIIGTAGIIALTVLPLFMLKIIPRSEIPAFSKFSWLTCLAGIVFMILFNFRFFSPMENSLNRLEGLWQRLFALDYYIYIAYIAWLMIKKYYAFKEIYP